ncbi:methylthioribulose 1-phosphate dehydratase [Pseudalkalibacillus salsuginis]|uniref:methylthioribulose 1-phosphate dehydratase n=1 Tax=Pseudalkalibacillus salsuginis TaxID=2910972 RepID=UPI001F2FB219|nr:methylthioribulose 1-phosphate dehydratase [Pseudalkalibacillus salsuginis]MCF6409834.1 methylthioribulose 1-phosphate dehydratase [Pseudalkalibacillus salsuginis]
MSKSNECWNELADVKDELAARDWFPGTSGNLSIKVQSDPLQFLVTASGKDKRKRTAEDFVLVDENCVPVEETLLRPSAETLIHKEIYQRTDASCCLHVHTVDNNVISELYGDEKRVVFTGQELIKAFGLWDEDAEIMVPIVENHADIPTLTEELTANLGEGVHGILIRNHGITVWGKSAFEAKKFLEAFEFLFSYHLKIKSYKSLSLS